MYSLLRNNKQSGPYSLDQLKTMGLKAYDLVWVDGRSAAWRYPCEIEELKAFAPAVDEQPFDRFFKKPSAGKTAAATTESVYSSSSVEESASPTTFSGTSVSATTISATTTSSPNIFSGDHTSTPRKRNIYVTMPGGAAPFNGREAQPDPAPANAGRPQASAPTHQESTPTPSYVFSERTAARQPLDEERFVEIIPRETQRHSGQRHSASILRLLAIGGCILILLAAGVLIGLSINKDSLERSIKIASRSGSNDNGSAIAHTTAQQLPAPPVSNPAASTPVTQQATPSTSSANKQVTAAAQTKTAELKGSELTTAAPVVKTPKIIAAKGKPASANSIPVLPAKTADTTTVRQPAIREAVHRTDPDETASAIDKEAVRTGLMNQLSVSASKYEVGTFGGISGLQLTVTNRSAHALDLVVVEVQYIQANKKTYKTENLFFRGIGPGMALMLEAPKSTRGIKVQYKITTINSKEVGLTEPGI